MIEAVRWYLALSVAGAGGLLPAIVLFGRLRSGGVLYARPLGLLAIAYAAWTASALGVAPYGTGLVVAAAAALWAVSAALGWRRPELLRALWARRTQLLVGELLFVALFALILLVRVQAPDAQYTEKPSDLMVLTAVSRAEQMPPLDPWFAGERLSYYHLGQTAVDVTARLAGVDLGGAFVLGVAAAGALAGLAVFALGGDLLALSPLRRRASPWIAGALAVTSLLVLATLEGGFELLAANGIGGEAVWGWLGIAGLPPPVGASGGVPDGFWWWWRATRVVPGTIMEFPAFSLILGDLHAHLLALPLAVLAVAVAATTFEGGQPLTWRRWLARPGALLLSGLLFAGLAMTNSLDAAIYGALWFAAALAAFMRAGWGPLGAAFGAVRYLLPPVAVALVLAAPFLATIEGGARGLEFVTDSPADPLRMAVVWLPLALPLAAAAVLLRPRLTASLAARGVLAAVSLLALWALVAALSGERATFEFRGSGWITLAALTLLVALPGAAAAAAYRDGERGRAAWLGLAALAVSLLLAAELVQVAIAFGARWNMVFKAWYAAWLLLALAGGVAIGDAFDRLPRVRPPALVLVALAGCALIYGGSLLYAPAAAVSRAREGQTAGIDALAYLERSGDPRAAAIAWVRSNLRPSDTLLEAVGEIYSAGNFVSAASGVPTLLGWPQHECQWRGDAAECRERGESAEITARRAIVARIYNEGATEGAGELATANGITHIYLGREERRQFGPAVTARFDAWPTRFEAAGVRIVEVPR